MIKPPCTKDCPDRHTYETHPESPNCHTAAICERWAIYEQQKKEERKEIEKAIDLRTYETIVHDREARKMRRKKGEKHK